MGGARAQTRLFIASSCYTGMNVLLRLSKISLASGHVLHVVFTQSLFISRDFNARYIFRW